MGLSSDEGILSPISVSLGHCTRCYKDTSYEDNSTPKKLTIRQQSGTQHAQKKKKNWRLVAKNLAKKSGTFSLGQYPPVRRSLVRPV